MSTTLPDVVDNVEQLRARRDVKLAPVVRDFKPAWIREVTVSMSNLQLVFDLIYRPYAGRGWIRRRYRYDGEVDVLHYDGEVDFPERELSDLPDSALVR